MVHETAAKGFARGAWDYETGRPSYPADAVQWMIDELGIGSDSFVVDIGAGTGKFTRLIAPTGARLLAVEPVLEMRAVFTEVLPDVEVVDGTAEAVPVEDGVVDVVTAAQAFHWADAERGFAEFHRVLKPGGAIGFIWNSRAKTGWESRITALMDRVAGAEPRYGTAGEGAWEAVVEAHPGFGPLVRRDFALDHPTTRAATMARVASTSYVSALPDAQRDAVLAEVTAILDDAGVDEQFTEAYSTQVFLCRKL